VAKRTNRTNVKRDLIDIGANLARFRRERALTQVELARELGISQSQFSQYERGVLRLHGQLIVRLTQLLGVTADALLGIQAGGNQDVQLQRRFLRKLHSVGKLSRRDQSALLRTIDGFIRGQLEKSA